MFDLTVKMNNSWFQKMLFWFDDENAKGGFHYHLNQILHRFHTSVFGIPMVIASPVMYLKF